jgi:non-specific serine/threonine protein kinase
MPRLGLRLTPQRHILLEAAEDAPILDDMIAERLADAFARGTGHGLLRLGACEVGQVLSPAFAWWRDFAARYVGALCLLAPGAASETPSSSVLPAVPPPTDGEIATLVLTAPMMPGAEYLNADVLLALWDELGAAFAASLARSGADLQTFLKGLNPAWNLVGRVHFNLAENRHDPELPFAFMATYTTRLSPQAKAQHVPLGQALREYSGAANRDGLLSLLVPVQRAAERCGWLKAMVDAGEIFHPLRWSPADAAQFLSSVPDLESAGVVVRMPATWRANRPPRPQVTATVGARPPSAAGLDGLLDFHMDVTLEGEPLTDEEIATLLAGTDMLVLLRGQWVEIDRERLERAMRRFREAQALAGRDGLTFAEAMRLLAGAAVTGTDKDTRIADWSRVTAGPGWPRR